MRLLDKKSIAKDTADQRKLEIDEAVKLAKKIDYLREESAKEEKRFGLYREANLKTIKAEMQPLLEKKGELIDQITSLERQRNELMLPLDEAWEAVRLAEIDIEERNEDLFTREEYIIQQLEALATKKADLELEESRIQDMEEIANQKITHASHDSFTALDLLNKARKEADKILKEAESRNSEVIKREIVCASDERDIINKKKLLDKRERDLNLQERAITDKYQTLLRTEAHVKRK